MIEWYVEARPYSTPHTDEYIQNVIRIASPLMNYFCKKLYEKNDLTLATIEDTFKEIINGLSVMNTKIIKDEFVICYNKTTYIKLVDTTKQIYRDIKLEKILQK